MTPEAYRIMRDAEEREKARCPRRWKKRSQCHVQAAMLHLDLAMDYFREHDRCGGLRLLRVFRELKPYSIQLTAQ